MEPVRGVDFILRGLNDDYMQLAMSNLGKTAKRVTSGNLFLIFGAGDEDAELSVVCTIPLLDSRLLLGANADSAIPPIIIIKPSSAAARPPPKAYTPPPKSQLVKFWGYYSSQNEAVNSTLLFDWYNERTKRWLELM